MVLDAEGLLCEQGHCPPSQWDYSAHWDGAPDVPAQNPVLPMVSLSTWMQGKDLEYIA